MNTCEPRAQSRAFDYAAQSIDHWINVDGLVNDAIIFPSADALKNTPQYAFVKATALLKLRDKSIWMLSCRSRAWTPIEVRHVAEKLLARHQSDGDSVSLRQAVAKHSDLQDRIVWDNLSMRTIAQQWGVNDYVASLYSAESSFKEKTDRGESEDMLLRALTDQITAFVATLDPLVQSSALSGGALNIWTYNYFIDPHLGRQRRQFGATFPLLISTVACPAECDKFDEALCRLVDSSAPLAKQLSAMWGVAPRVIRQLVGLSAATVGSEWHGNARDLAEILDRLPPEALPTGSKQWTAFNKAADIAKEWSSSRGFAQSALIGGSILRSGTRAWKHEDTDIAQCFDDAPFLRDAITRLLLCLELFINAEIRLLRPGVQMRPEVLTDIATETLEALLRRGKLVTAAQQFAQQSYSMIDIQDIEMKLIYGIAVPPLLLYEFVSSDNSRRIRSLTSPEQFRDLGRALNTCLGKSPSYFEECRSQRIAILAILENSSGKPLSTAKIELEKVGVWDRWRLEVVMHTGYENAPVDQACAKAIAEMLAHCKDPQVQREIGQRQTLLPAARNDRRAWAHLVARHPELLGAVKKTIGRAAYQLAIECALRSLSIAATGAPISPEFSPSHLGSA